VNRYYPLPVLPSFTDDALRSSLAYGPAVVDLLLQIPAEYRQACEIEVNRRSTRVDRSGPLHIAESIGSPSAARAAVVAEILAQLANGGVR
jgi:hypothetical protein